MKVTLRISGLLGILLFGVLFIFTFGVPEAIEKSAKTFIKSQIEKEIKQKYQKSKKTQSVKEKAILLASKFGMEEEELKQYIREKLPEKIASVVASMCGYDCEKEKQLAVSITKGYLKKISNLKIAQKTLGEIIKSKYMEIVTNLKIDIRIFLGSNFAMFSILVLVSFLKPNAINHLFLPGVFLFISTVISSCIYIFGQDWFYTIIYNNYWGFGYLIYILVIFSFLMDITFNKARVTTEIINGILSSIGSAFSVVPC